jgi:riboflavin synthase alpha subunit
MFTGLVQAVGRVAERRTTAAGARLVITAPWEYAVEPGASVAVNGVCLTATPLDSDVTHAVPAHPAPADAEPAEAGAAPAHAGADAASPWARGVAFDVVTETLDRSSLGRLKQGDAVNLEHAARADTLLGGHIVQGHVDALGIVHSVLDNPADWRLRVSVDADTLLYIAPKGSVTIDGVSLTVAAVHDDEPGFTVALIPTTLDHTTLRSLQLGDAINIETDIIARQVVHALRRLQPDTHPGDV